MIKIEGDVTREYRAVYNASVIGEDLRLKLVHQVHEFRARNDQEAQRTALAYYRTTFLEDPTQRYVAPTIVELTRLKRIPIPLELMMRV